MNLGRAAGNEILQVFGGRRYAREQQMFARSSAGNIEQTPFGFINVVEFRLVRGVGDPLVQRQSALVTGHYGHGTELQSLGKANRSRRYLTFAGKSCNRGAGASDELRRTDEQADLARRYSFPEPCLDRFADRVAFLGY